jgi:DNA-binding NarL/FixJ family response regulator
LPKSQLFAQSKKKEMCRLLFEYGSAITFGAAGEPRQTGGVVSGSRLLLADDHPLIREGLALAARVAMPELTIDSVGTIAEAEGVIARHRGYRLALLDLVLPDARGFSGFLRIQHALGDVPIVIVSARQQPELIEAARALGAAGYLSKAQPLDETLASLKAVLAGKTVFPPCGKGGHAEATARQRITDLSGAQFRVLMALADGRLNKQIAGELGVTEATVKAHMTAIFRKLGVTNRTQAILAMQPLLADRTDEPR